MAGLLNPSAPVNTTWQEAMGVPTTTPALKEADSVQPSSEKAQKNKATKEAISVLVNAVYRLNFQDQLNEAEAEALKYLVLRVNAARSNKFGEPMFYQIFGKDAMPGTTAKLYDIITKHLKGIDWMQSNLRKWAARGPAVVRFVENKQAPMESIYVVDHFLK